MTLKTALEVIKNEQSHTYQPFDAIDEFTVLVNCGAVEKPSGSVPCA
jgi:hypothetical protein